MKVNKHLLGSYLRQGRIHNDLTLREAAIQTTDAYGSSVNVASVHAYESGASTPGLDRLLSMCEVYFGEKAIDVLCVILKASVMEGK